MARNQVRRPLSKRERSSLRVSCRYASGSRRSTWSPNRRRAYPSIELGRHLGVTQTAAWMMKHKLAQVMLERNVSKRLKGNVQMDDAYIGGARSGRRESGAAGKTPFVAAIATTDDGKPDQIILRPVKAFSSLAIRKLASTALRPGANSVSDGLACFAAVTQAGCLHSSIKTGSGKQAARAPALNGSTPHWAISKPLSWGPTAPCEKNTSLDISPSSNIVSIADTISQP